MAYKALYRIYRPQTFNDVVGQKHILQTLKNAIRDNKIAHAYLFSGPRGTGKTSLAKLLAKALNCDHDLAFERPCNECENCRAISEGNHPDVIELDAASNNGVDEVRDIIDKVKYAPSMGRYKVYIIDEVHMMTPGAFNALLKTLEEPPFHVVFILATTDVHKVLPTIVSRCQRFDFNRVSNNDMKERIVTILNNENVSYEEGVIDLICELAEGGMRDALSILDQTIAYAGKDLKVDHIRDIYGIATSKEMVNFLNMCNNNDIEGVLSQIDDFEKKGLDFVRLTQSLIATLKETIIYKKSNNEALLKRITKNEAYELANGKTIKTLFYNIDVLVDALANYRKVNNPLEYFTLASLKICEKVKAEPLEEVKEVKEVKKVVKEEVKEEKKEEIKIEPFSKEEIIYELTEEKEEKPQKVLKSSSKKKHRILFDDKDIINIALQSSKKEKQEIIEKWGLVRNYLNITTFQRASNLLVDGQPVMVSSKAIVFAFDSLHQADLVNIYENQLIINELLKEIYGREYYFYAISQEKLQDIKTQFRMRSIEKTLPEPFEILPPRHEDIEEEEKEVDQDLLKVQALFGDGLIVEE